MLVVSAAGKYSGLFTSTMRAMITKNTVTGENRVRTSIIHSVGILNRLAMDSAMVTLVSPEKTFDPAGLMRPLAAAVGLISRGYTCDNHLGFQKGFSPIGPG